MSTPASVKTVIPEKKYFRIGEVSDLVGVETHVLRYWESEFPMIRPDRGISKQRLYRRQDVELIVRIRDLLHDHGYTIAGARRLIECGAEPEETGNVDAGAVLARVRKELEEIRKKLQG